MRLPRPGIRMEAEALTIRSPRCQGEALRLRARAVVWAALAVVMRNSSCAPPRGVRIAPYSVPLDTGKGFRLSALCSASHQPVTTPQSGGTYLPAG